MNEEMMPEIDDIDVLERELKNRNFVSDAARYANEVDGRMTPIFPVIGSRIIAAICSLCSSKSCLTVSISLNLAVKVPAAIPFVTPGEFGCPSVRAPDPAFIRKPVISQTLFNFCLLECLLIMKWLRKSVKGYTMD